MNIAVLISGSGRTLKNFFDLGDKLGTTIKLVVAHSPGVSGLRHVRFKHDIITLVSDDSEEIFDRFDRQGIALAAMAGWIKFLRIPSHWANRVMNIHPSLLPAFGGKGMYGNKIHKAVIENGVKFSGCTVHFADEEYDHGPIILQRVVPVLDDDTPDVLAARVFEQEKLAYPEAISLYAQGRLEVTGRRVSVRRPR